MPSKIEGDLELTDLSALELEESDLELTELASESESRPISTDSWYYKDVSGRLRHSPPGTQISLDLIQGEDSSHGKRLQQQQPRQAEQRNSSSYSKSNSRNTKMSKVSHEIQEQKVDPHGDGNGNTHGAESNTTTEGGGQQRKLVRKTSIGQARWGKVRKEVKRMHVSTIMQKLSEQQEKV